MKIMHVHKDINTSVNAGGINTVYLKHIEELLKLKQEIIAVTSRDGNWELGAKRYVVSSDKSFREDEIKEIINYEKPDIVDVFSWGAELHNYVNEKNKPKIIMRADIPMKYYGLKPLDEEMARKCDEVVSISKWCDFEWSSVLGKSTIIIPHASDDVDVINYNKQRNSVLWVGKATDVKGFDLLFNLPEEFFKEFNLTVVCAKTKYTDNLLFERLENLGVTIKENLSDNEYKKLLSEVEFVLSTARREGFCIAVLEAMKNGAIPVVPYWIGGTLDFVNNNNGIIYKDLNDCYNQMKNLNDREMYMCNAIDDASYYTWENVAKKSLNLYRKVLK